MSWYWYGIVIMTIFLVSSHANIELHVSPNKKLSLQTYSSINNPNNCYYSSGSSIVEDGFCFPSLIVAGFPKCGTSYLFRILANNPAIIATKRKELCLGGPLTEDWEKMILKLPTIKETGNAFVMSGCLHLGASTRATSELQIVGTKLLYVVRDVADMLWAAYNYWCIPTIDTGCTPGARTNELSKRSPQHFHSMIQQNLPMGGGIALENDGNCYRAELELAVSRFGKSNVKVWKSEDFLDEERKLGLLHSITSFIGIHDRSTDWIRIESMKSQRVNAGHLINNRGEKATSNATNVNGLYEVSGFLPMLEETRKLIDGRWKDECIWLRSEFSIIYDSCR